jgi:hypothetical protein
MEDARIAPLKPRVNLPIHRVDRKTSHFRQRIALNFVFPLNFTVLFQLFHRKRT